MIGEGEAAIPSLLATPSSVVHAVPVADISRVRPARDLTRRRSRYFVGDLMPCASIELSRGKRLASAEVVANELLDIREPNVFIVDDVAFAYTDHDAHHAVMATRLSLADFYDELVQAQTIAQRQYMGWRAVFASRSAHNAPRRLADHRRPVAYQLRRSPEHKRSERREISFERHQQPHQSGQRQTV